MKSSRKGLNFQPCCLNWQRYTDPGPYDFGGTKIDWDRVLQGDRFFALLQIRALTYGPDYAFAVTSDRDWLLERIGEQRSKEAQAIEKAGKKR